MIVDEYISAMGSVFIYLGDKLDTLTLQKGRIILIEFVFVDFNKFKKCKT
jgi:hypothetical protein